MNLPSFVMYSAAWYMIDLLYVIFMQTTTKAVNCCCFYKYDDTLLITYGADHLFFWRLFWDPVSGQDGKLYRDKLSGVFEVRFFPSLLELFPVTFKNSLHRIRIYYIPRMGFNVIHSSIMTLEQWGFLIVSSTTYIVSNNSHVKDQKTPISCLIPSSRVRNQMKCVSPHSNF